MSKHTKLWQSDNAVDADVENFTIGDDPQTDLILAEYDIIGSLAHGTMLNHTGLIEDAEWQKIRPALLALYEEAGNGRLVIDPGVEDIHSQVELRLTRSLGEAGGRIHTGRSRNDQVLLDLRLYMRDRIRSLTTETSGVFHRLLELSERYKDIFMPGYTHLQIAMPSSFGLWFAAYAESLVDDMIQMHSAFRIVNRNPLGSAAGYGSSFPIDRQMTTDLLGFDTMNFNSIYAQMGRGRSERVVSQAVSSLADTVARLANDIILFMSQNFGFFSLSGSLTSGSSIMPHKKNPDVLELIRARCNRLKALPNEIMMMTANLPSGYFRDLQLLKRPVIEQFSTIGECLRMLRYILEHIGINEHILDNGIYSDIYSVEKVNQLVLEGMTFRQAYRRVAEDLKNGIPLRPDPGILHTHEGSTGNLCNDRIREIMEQVLAGFHFERMDAAVENLLAGSGGQDSSRSR